MNRRRETQSSCDLIVPQNTAKKRARVGSDETESRFIGRFSGCFDVEPRQVGLSRWDPREKADAFQSDGKCSVNRVSRPAFGGSTVVVLAREENLGVDFRTLGVSADGRRFAKN